MEIDTRTMQKLNKLRVPLVGWEAIPPFERPTTSVVVGLEDTPVNNHGCSGFFVSIAPVSKRRGIVVAGGSCSSCWQVGHDDSGSTISLGTLVELPADFVGGWREASELVGRSHNELVDDRDEPQPDCTRIAPRDLVQTGQVINGLAIMEAADALIRRQMGFAEFKRVMRENS